MLALRSLRRSSCAREPSRVLGDTSLRGYHLRSASSYGGSGRIAFLVTKAQRSSKSSSRGIGELPAGDLRSGRSRPHFGDGSCRSLALLGDDRTTLGTMGYLDWFSLPRVWVAGFAADVSRLGDHARQLFVSDANGLGDRCYSVNRMATCYNALDSRITEPRATTCYELLQVVLSRHARVCAGNSRARVRVCPCLAVVSRVFIGPAFAAQRYFILYREQAQTTTSSRPQSRNSRESTSRLRRRWSRLSTREITTPPAIRPQSRSMRAISRSRPGCQRRSGRRLTFVGFYMTSERSACRSACWRKRAR